VKQHEPPDAGSREICRRSTTQAADAGNEHGAVGQQSLLGLPETG
jgi:hypothetical protein